MIPEVPFAASESFLVIMASEGEENPPGVDAATMEASPPDRTSRGVVGGGSDAIPRAYLAGCDATEPSRGNSV